MPHKTRLPFLLLITALLTACLPVSLAATPAPVADTTPDAAINVIFTENNPAAQNALRNAINNARYSIDLAIYNITNEAIGDALLAAARRGVHVRMVMESNQMDGIVPRGLMEAGIPIHGDNRDALMHDKFMVIDGAGRMDRLSQLHLQRPDPQDNNNLVHIRSSRLAENYTTEFEEMFADGPALAPTARPTPPTPSSVWTACCSSPTSHPMTAFSIPSGEPRGQRRPTPASAIMAFSFTSDELAAAVLDKARQGVIVQIVMDEEQANSNQSGEYENFAQRRPGRAPGWQPRPDAPQSHHHRRRHRQLRLLQLLQQRRTPQRRKRDHRP